MTLAADTGFVPSYGHNEMAVRLGILASDAQLALDRVAKGEGDAIEGWLAYGAALNEGRKLLPSDEQFGQWVRDSQLARDGITYDERSAAMWAAANPDQFAEARVAGNARTVRGIHAKWNEISAERAAAAARAAAEKARKEAEARAAAEAEARRREQEAKDEAARKAAEAAKEEAARAAAKAEKDAKAAEKKADAAAKKADKVKAGNTSADNVRGTAGTGENEWYTPAAILDAARDVLGAFDLDPASNAEAQASVQAARFFTKEDDGLRQEWGGRVWLNPPYAQPHIADFVSKMVAERRAGRVAAGIMLTHNYTDTAWFHEAAAVAEAICFTRGRVKFYDAAGNVAAPTQGQALFYFGPDALAFAERFSRVGFVVLPFDGEVSDAA